jgi:hypothetical protein
MERLGSCRCPLWSKIRPQEIITTVGADQSRGHSRQVGRSWIDQIAGFPIGVEFFFVGVQTLEIIKAADIFIEIMQRALRTRRGGMLAHTGESAQAQTKCRVTARFGLSE